MDEGIKEATHGSTTTPDYEINLRARCAHTAEISSVAENKSIVINWITENYHGAIISDAQKTYSQALVITIKCSLAITRNHKWGENLCYKLDLFFNKKLVFSSFVTISAVPYIFY